MFLLMRSLLEAFDYFLRYRLLLNGRGVREARRVAVERTRATRAVCQCRAAACVHVAAHASTATNAAGRAHICCAVSFGFVVVVVVFV